MKQFAENHVRFMRIIAQFQFWKEFYIVLHAVFSNYNSVKSILFKHRKKEMLIILWTIAIFTFIDISFDFIKIPWLAEKMERRYGDSTFRTYE